MDIGGKIRSLRVAKLMTQAELAGSVITRNMLSSIENGNANPSLSTITYIAGRLNVPVGFLLAEEGDEALYRKMNSLSNIKRAYKAGDLQGCRALCLSACPEPDDELCLLLAECDLGIAKDFFWQGKLHLASAYFDEAVQYARQTSYPAPQIAAVTKVYYTYLQRISPSFYSDDSDDENEYLWKDSFADYVNALEALDKGNAEPARNYRRLKEDDPQFFENSLQLKCLMAEGDYSGAKNGFLTLLEGEETFNAVNLYSLLCDLEICCRETEDYKGAYQYSNERSQLLQQLLQEG